MNINNGFDGRITKLSKDTNRGIAMQFVIAGLHPLDYNPEHKFDIAAKLWSLSECKCCSY